MAIRQAALLLAACACTARARDDGLRLPPMGWMSWERYGCQKDCAGHPDACINAALFEAQAQALCMQTQDFTRAYNAFVAKEKPVFEGD